MILIYGIKKSGTTFLQRLLDSKKIFTPPCETKIKFYREFAKNKNENMISDVNLKKYFPLDDFVNYNYATYIEIIKKSYKKVNNLNDFIQLHLNSIKKSYNYKLKTKIDIIKDVSGTPSEIINDFLKC